MKTHTLEINAIIVTDKNVNLSSINQEEISKMLGNGFASEPTYIKMSNVSVFDYMSNPDFPVQLNIQGNKIIFILSGNASFDFGKKDKINEFTNKFIEILNSDSFKNYIGNIKAIGTNIAVSVVSDSDEKLFQSLLLNFQEILSSQGSFHAGGIRLLRKNDNKRLEVSLEPVIPDMGNDFTESYIIKINKHIEPINNSWTEDIRNQLISFNKESSDIIKELNK